MGDRIENAAPSPATTIDDVPSDLLEQIFLRMPSSLHLVRAACAFKRWRRIVASGGFLRRFRSLHPRPILAGHYRVDGHKHGSRPPGCNPVFSLSRSACTVGMRPHHFSLDFLPDCYGDSWDLADSRDGILLLTNCAEDEDSAIYSLIVCEPMTRRCSSVINFPGFLANWDCFGAFLLNGKAEPDETGGHISVSNFRIIIAVYDEGAARTSTFSSASNTWWIVGQRSGNPYSVSWSGKIFLAGQTEDSIYWTTRDDSMNSEVLVLDKHTDAFSASLFPEQLPYWPVEPKLRVVRSDDGTVRIALLDVNRLRVFIQGKGRDSDQWAVASGISLRGPISELRGVGEWHSSVTIPTEILSVVDGSVVLGTKREGLGLFSVDLATMEFKHVQDEVNYPAYMYHLPWPPTIRACIP